MEENTIEEYSEYPCENCSHKDYCDHWEARYCCQLCDYYNDNPDNYDPMDI